ncbi:MAG: DUF2330 domain-containing protein [Myxococcales bacterium]|nr:DUF2330 domain-containing protein [Myxococcales bacterium]
MGIVPFLVLLALPPQGAQAWASVSALPGPVPHGAEHALLLWDPDGGREQLAIRVDYETSAPSVGLLIDLPTSPTAVTEHPSAVIEGLSGLAGPRVRVREVFNSASLRSLFFFDSFAAGAHPPPVPPPPTTTRRMTSFVTMSPEGGSSLEEWFRENGWPMRPSLARWVEAARKRNRHVLGVRIERPEGLPADRPLRTPLLRIQFKTTQPMVPYGEPDDEIHHRPALRVFAVLPFRATGAIDGATAAPQRTPYAQTILDPALFRSAFEGGTVPPDPWLTILDVPAKRAPGLALHLHRHAKQSPTKPETKVVDEPRIYPPFGIPACLALTLAFLTWTRKRRRRRPS